MPPEASRTHSPSRSCLRPGSPAAPSPRQTWLSSWPTGLWTLGDWGAPFFRLARLFSRECLGQRDVRALRMRGGSSCWGRVGEFELGQNQPENPSPAATPPLLPAKEADIFHLILILFHSNNPVLYGETQRILNPVILKFKASSS